MCQPEMPALHVAIAVTIAIAIAIRHIATTAVLIVNTACSHLR